jgi:hypothetical protein
VKPEEVLFPADGGLAPGVRFRWGDKACVVGLTNGKRVVKIVAHLPTGAVVTDHGLDALYAAWIQAGQTLGPERAGAVLLAEALDPSEVITGFAFPSPEDP